LPGRFADGWIKVNAAGERDKVGKGKEIVPWLVSTDLKPQDWLPGLLLCQEERFQNLKGDSTIYTSEIQRIIRECFKNILTNWKT
jgi:hypothetical protein